MPGILKRKIIQYLRRRQSAYFIYDIVDNNRDRIRIAGQGSRRDARRESSGARYSGFWRKVIMYKTDGIRE